MDQKTVGVTLLGRGTVGSGVGRILVEHQELLRRRTGLALEIRHVVVRDPQKHRSVAPLLPYTTDAESAIADPGTDIVVELIGGTARAGELVAQALKLGRPVVTANNALLAHQGERLFALAREHHTCIAFEASCAGGIPIVDVLARSLVGNRIDALLGIVNGTCNFILTKMTRDRWSYEQGVKEARRLGYAEANPAIDLSGRDTAHKLAILGSLAFDRRVRLEEIHIEGIDTLQAADVAFVRGLGYVIKLLAIAERVGEAISLRVHPALVRQDDLLADVNGSFNAISVWGSALGHAFFYGRGAGQMPAASAVVSDIVSAALGTAAARFRQMEVFSGGAEPARVLPFEELRSRYYVRLDARDRPGVLAQVTAALGRHGISVSAIHQPEGGREETAPVLITTHLSQEGAMQRALQEISALEAVAAPAVCLRIVDRPGEAVPG